PFWYNKIDSLKWIDGSIRADLNSAERGVWADLLAMAGLTRDERRGFIERSEGIPYPKSVILSRLNIEEELLDRTVRKCVTEGRLKVYPDGTLEITHWAKYNDTKDYNAKKESKRLAIEKAKRTKSELETLLHRGIITQNVLTTATKALTDIAQGVDLKIPLACAYCDEHCNHTVDLARHILQTKKNGHEPGKAWAKEYLKIKED
ncbi:MAG: hypothetical protein KKG95_08220, partial [Candidatus Omnitrophica bacterium]|nr:hypothetical protein [Candidatus Omnitrophota bacterium]